MYLEKAGHHSYRSGYLPDGYAECGGCGYPDSGGLCAFCEYRVSELISKATVGPGYIPEMDPAVGTNLEVCFE
jgi:hypothetical protein